MGRHNYTWTWSHHIFLHFSCALNSQARAH
uniref:Uncharacterized protein n=1 Tax=Rhizophora mucronata TaxID=61149 RepID=A0A2P2R4J9_RHIMU